MGKARPVSERFWEKVNKHTLTGCWEWGGSRLPTGYGHLWLNGRMRGAHRISYELHKGRLPPGHHACHHCDNPPCVNPEHLFAGTNRDNALDKTSKGRQNIRGKRFKIPTQELAEMATRFHGGTKQAQLAKEFGVCTRTVQRAVELSKMHTEKDSKV